jgi:hypothetical protein
MAKKLSKCDLYASYTQVCGARHLLYTDVCLRRNELDSSVNFRAFLNAPLLAINISASIAFRHISDGRKGRQDCAARDNAQHPSIGNRAAEKGRIPCAGRRVV